MAWQEHGGLLEDAGNVGGKLQAGKSFSRGFLNPALPEAVVVIYAFPISGAPFSAEGKFGVLHLGEYLLCADVRDPENTKTWSTWQFARFDKNAYDTAAAAEAACRSSMQNFTAKTVTWDGKQFRGM